MKSTSWSSPPFLAGDLGLFLGAGDPVSLGTGAPLEPNSSGRGGELHSFLSSSVACIDQEVVRFALRAEEEMVEGVA